MAVKSTVVAVATTATRLDTLNESDSRSGSSVALYNDGAATIYIGGSDVTTSGATKGYPVAAGSYGPGMDLGTEEALYGIVASGTVNMIVLETSI